MKWFTWLYESKYYFWFCMVFMVASGLTTAADIILHKYVWTVIGGAAFLLWARNAYIANKPEMHPTEEQIQEVLAFLRQYCRDYSSPAVPLIINEQRVRATWQTRTGRQLFYKTYQIMMDWRKN